MSSSCPALDCTIPPYARFRFSGCTGDNTKDILHAKTVVHPDIADAMSIMANKKQLGGLTDGNDGQHDNSTVETPLETQEYTEDDESDAEDAEDDDCSDPEAFSPFALAHSSSGASRLVGFQDEADRDPPMAPNLLTMDVSGSGALLANTAALPTSDSSVAMSTMANGNHLFGVTDDIVHKPDNTVVDHRVNDMNVDDGNDYDIFDLYVALESSDSSDFEQFSPVEIQHFSKFPPNLLAMDAGALLANTAALATSDSSVAMPTMANGNHLYGVADSIVRKPGNTVVGHRVNDMPFFMTSPMRLDMGDPGVPRADTVSLSTSSDSQSNEAPLHTYGDGPYGEEGNDTNMLAPEPTVALSVCAGATRSLSPKLELVRRFDKPLTLDLLATISEMNEVQAMKIPKKELLFTLLSSFLLLQPRGTPRLEGGQVWNGLIRQEEFHELVNKSKLNPAVMSEVTALLMYMKTKMDFIGESFYLLIASCMIGKGVYYCSSRTNATSQYRVLKAVYEAIIEKKPRKQRGQKTP